MNKKNVLLSLFAAMTALTTANAADFTNTEGGVIINVTSPANNVMGFGEAPRQVRLQVVSDNIIKVSATAENSFVDKPSLIIVPQSTNTHYDVKEENGTIIVSTSKVKAHVKVSTGEVWFTNAAGRLILKEVDGGGKAFLPYECKQIHADGTPELYRGWSTRTVFENINPNEALYGLGQHQADEWNYKGKNEELFQYNTKVSIPFIVSSAGYGVLFDNYSLSRFGNPNDYSQLNHVFTLHDKDGNIGALTGTYNISGNESITRREDSIYFEDIVTTKNLPKCDLAKATVVYEGTLTPSKTGEYRFSHYYSGYQKIFINDKSVYTEDLLSSGSDDQEIWRTAWNPNARKFAIKLEAGKTYKIRIEWKPDGGEAYCGLRALEPVSDIEQQRLSMYSEMAQQLDYYFILGQNNQNTQDINNREQSNQYLVHGTHTAIDNVIAGYRQLTGKAQIMPRWLLGYWQSRERYKTQNEILDALKGFRKRHLPIDNIVMDWNYWENDSWGSFEFEKSRFPDPKAMIDSIHAMNGKIMISCWPKYYLTVDNFKELNDRGMIYQQSIKDSLYDWLGYKYAFYDAYDKDARKIFWRQLYEKLGTIGMDAWWMDASEPNVRDCTSIPYRKLLCGPTIYGSSDEYFNAYSIVNAEAIYDGQRAYETAIERNGIKADDSHTLQASTHWNEYGYDNTFSPENKRVFLLTRNGFASEQRYSTATWSGDIGTRWEDMKAQITAGLNFSISGVPYWSQDIGGFSVENRYAKAQQEYDQTGVESADLKEWRELNVRWHQMGMFAPMYRSHGQFPYREPWNIAPEGHAAYNAISQCLDMRYRLLPYIYSLAADVHFSDYTIMRPLVMDFANDEKALNTPYQFMFGPAIMVNPVYKYCARSREVYMPKGTKWYDLYSGELISNGGETKTLSAPYERIPLLVRAGGIIPLGPKMEYTRQKQADTLRIFVYEGADGEFNLYEDEDENYGYEAGRYATIQFCYDDNAKTLAISDRHGQFPGILQKRTFVIVPCKANKPVAYNPDANGIVVKYSGKKKIVKLN